MKSCSGWKWSLSLAPVPPESLCVASLCFIWYFSMGNYRTLGLDKSFTLQIILQSATSAVNGVRLVTMTTPNAPHISKWSMSGKCHLWWRTTRIMGYSHGVAEWCLNSLSLHFIHHCHCDNLKINSGQQESKYNKETKKWQNNQLHKNIKFSESKHGRNQICVILSAAMVILRIAKNAKNSKQVLLICFLLNIIWETEKRKYNHNDYLISDEWPWEKHSFWWGERKQKDALLL